MTAPRIIDNDRGEIRAELEGVVIRGWVYRDDAERRVKMLAAREFAEGYYQASKGKPELIEACRAQYAWSYCEEHGLGSFNQRGVLCAHSNYLTAKAIAMVEGRDFDAEYKGNKQLIVWPEVRLHESDEAEANELVQQAFDHEARRET